MSLHVAAQHLAAHGRNGDTQLVHMTPGEVRSLQDLAKAHGGSLTTNPHTGLPEASFLSTVLPLAAGVALGPAGLGLSAGTAGLIAGGATALMSGSLTKGLMAGLGAYGGAGLGEGLAGVGTSEAGANISQAAEAQGQEAVQRAMAERQAQISAAENAGGYSMMDPLQPLSEAQRQATFGNAYINYEPTAAQEAMLNNPMRTGISALIDDPSKIKDVGGGSWTGLAKMGAMALAPAAPDLLKRPDVNAPTMASTPNPVYTYNPGTINPTPQPNPYGIEQYYYDPARSGYTRTAADGGMMYGGDVQGDPNLMQVKTYDPVVRMDSGGRTRAYDTEPMKKPKGITDMPSYTNMPGITDTVGLYAQGGISNLGYYSDGGRLLRGPGDGVSDSIPAVIGHKQPARLADGEFVVPARIVSEIGNGSTEAGARKLYAMMDRVQNARAKTTGKGKIAKNTNADRYLPA